jgi:electron transport complex protein RnfG
MKNMIKLGLTLAIYATVACVMLAFVYTGTAKIIETRQKADLVAALKVLFPEADTFTPTDKIHSPDDQVTIEGAYKALRDSKLIGAAVRVSRESYGGAIKILVGINTRGTITGVKILEHKDTPGLGANAASPTYYVDKFNKITFYGQFTDKSGYDPLEIKEDVVAITASTITSKAVSGAVKAAGVGVIVWLDGGAQ